MRKALLFTLLALLGLALAGCSLLGEQVRGSGNVTTEQRAVGAFTAIVVAGVGEVVITQDDAERLAVETDDNLQAVVLSEVRGDTLYIGMKPNVSLGNVTKMIFTVTVRDLKRIALSGAAKISVRELDGNQLTVENSGLGALTMAGNVTEQHITLSGAGNYDGAALVSDRVTVAISGLGSVVVNVRQRLDATVSGSGSIAYIGSPEVYKQITGLGAIRQRAP